MEKKPVPAPFQPVFMREHNQVYYYVGFDAVIRLVFRKDNDNWFAEVEAIVQQSDNDVPGV